MSDIRCACAHLNVLYQRIEHDNGTSNDSWVCRDCGTPFWPKADPAPHPPAPENKPEMRCLNRGKPIEPCDLKPRCAGRGYVHTESDAFGNKSHWCDPSMTKLAEAPRPSLDQEEELPHFPERKGHCICGSEDHHAKVVCPNASASAPVAQERDARQWLIDYWKLTPKQAEGPSYEGSLRETSKMLDAYARPCYAAVERELLEEQQHSAELVVDVAVMNEQRDLWIERAAEWQHKHGDAEAQAAAAEAANEKLREALHCWQDFYPQCAQLLDGWHADGTAWSEWDESVRKQLVRCNLITAEVLEDRGAAQILRGALSKLEESR